jgi:ankyrin repeat protein
MWACINQDEEICTTLLQHGADVNLRDQVRGQHIKSSCITRLFVELCVRMVERRQHSS